MKITRTEMQHDIIENGSSYKVYICRTRKEASDIHSIALSMKNMVTGNAEGWYYTVSTCETDCRVPDFFKGKGYFETVIEHNNGDWNRKPAYELYLVE